MTLRKKIDDDESRRFWDAAKETAREVETWPAWKRCETTERKARAPTQAERIATSLNAAFTEMERADDDVLEQLATEARLAAARERRQAERRLSWAIARYCDEVLERRRWPARFRPAGRAQRAPRAV